MKQIFVMFALLLGVCAVNAQETDTVKYVAGNDLYRGITRKLPYRQMVTPYGVEVTFAKTVHIIFPAAVRYVDLGSNHIIAGKADGAENVIRVKATTEGFPGETNFSVICEDGSFFSFNAKYARAGNAQHRNERLLGERRHQRLFAHPHEHPFPGTG